MTTDYNPHFSFKASMSSDQKSSILLAILGESFDQKLTVKDVRTKISQRNPSEIVDPATLRRWVNSRFVSMTKKGLLIRHSGDTNRDTYFTVSNQFRRQLESSSEFAEKKNGSDPKFQTEANPSSISALKKDLENYRLQALAQMSEIGEFSRIINQYPDLSGPTTIRFNAAVDENCRTLGRIRALEKVLSFETEYFSNDS